MVVRVVLDAGLSLRFYVLSMCSMSLLGFSGLFLGCSSWLLGGSVVLDLDGVLDGIWCSRWFLMCSMWF